METEARELVIAHTWDGEPVGEVARVRWWWTTEGGVVEVDARDFGDPAPEGQGRHLRLWEHEVVELFLAEAPSREARYVELEFGPHGHWLALRFEGYRARVAEPEIRVEAERHCRGGEARWRARAEVPAAWVGLGYANAYAIHGSGAARRYLAAFSAPRGRHEGPDFHRIEYFGKAPKPG